MEKGKRKTQEPCRRCGLHPTRCLCASIPTWSLSTKLSLIIHHRELKRTTNTGRLALESLTNSNFFVRGRMGEPLDFSKILDPNYQPVILYPEDDSQELTPKFLSEFKKPIQLLVPDGNWRQASKVVIRSKELVDVPRVKISAQQMSERDEKFFMRKETKPEGMSTLEAIAEAFRVLESFEVFESLNSLYQLKLRRTLEGRSRS